MLKTSAYNFSTIHDRVNAAENLQRAGEDEMCEEILRSLAKEILGNGLEKKSK